MKNIELTKQETEAILNQLINLPMNQIENLVSFFREKLQVANQPEPEEATGQPDPEEETEQTKPKEDKKQE